MSLKTRLDGRSEENSSFQIKNPDGVVLAEIKLLGESGSTLEISTLDGLFIEKPNGWSSQNK
jgi:hypothetical protein